MIGNRTPGFTSPLTWALTALLAMPFAGKLQAQENPTDFEQDHYYKASNTRANTNFGSAVAVSGDTMVIGSPREDSGSRGVNGSQLDTSASNSGAAYVFVYDGRRWVQEAYLKASNTDANDRFGTAVAIDGDTIVIGAPEEDSAATGVGGSDSDNSSSNSGAAYVFTRQNGRWSQSAYLKASNTGSLDRFGTAVGVSGGGIVVGSPEEDSSAAGIDGDESDNSSINSGAVYLFVLDRSRWVQRHYIKASNSGASDRFGTSLSTDFDAFVVGAPGEDSDAFGVNGDQTSNRANDSGAAYLYRVFNTQLFLEAYIKSINTEPFDDFGRDVSLSGNTLVVGAPGEDSNATGIDGDIENNLKPESGAAYVYVYDFNGWGIEAYLKASNTDTGDSFGLRVDVSHDRLVVAAPLEASAATGIDGDQGNNSAARSGAVYAFSRNGRTWSTQQYLKSANSEGGDLFGADLDLSPEGDLLVGASEESSNATGVDGNADDNSSSGSGAAYLLSDQIGGLEEINAGLNDAWFEFSAPGQGIFVNVFPDKEEIFLAWFTYDVFRPPVDTPFILGEPGHRWVTAVGPYVGNKAELTVTLTAGGLFDQVPPVVENDSDYGTFSVTFHDCNHMTLDYRFTNPILEGRVQLVRAAGDTQALCEALR